MLGVHAQLHERHPIRPHPPDDKDQHARERIMTTSTADLGNRLLTLLDGRPVGWPMGTVETLAEHLLSQRGGS